MNSLKKDRRLSRGKKISIASILFISLFIVSCELFGTLEVTSWDNSTSWNGGLTGISANNVKFEASGNSISGSLNYLVYDRQNPNAIAQLFVAVERKIVATLYNGIPGSSSNGVSGNRSISFYYDKNMYGSSATIYLAGTWAISEEIGRNHYENQNGGWRCDIGQISSN